jgi:hypothetical protein
MFSFDMLGKEAPAWGTAQNVHFKSIELTPGLYLAGYGGSGPIFKNGEEIWPLGKYPFISDHHTKLKLNELWSGMNLGTDD